MYPSCPNCGNRQNSPGATVCRGCGRPIAAIVPALPQHNLSSTQPILQDQYGHRYRISLTGETHIGSQACAITIRNPKIRPRHARFFLDGGSIWVEPFSGSWILVNGQQVSSRQVLNDYDMVVIGPVQFTFLSGAQSLQSRLVPTFNPPVPAAIVQPTPTFPTQHGLASRLPDSDLEGEVRYIEGPYMEEPDPTFGKVLLKAGMFALALWKPAIILFVNNHRQVPVRYIRVEEPGSRLRVVKMKGEALTGMVSTGDVMQFWGVWNGGTLLMRTGYNRTTGSEIRLRQ